MVISVRLRQGVGSSVNQWGKVQLGVDIVDTIHDPIGGGPAHSGYNSIYSSGMHEDNLGLSTLLQSQLVLLFSKYHGTSTTTSAQDWEP